MPLHRHEMRHFPEGFLWGTSVSSHQTEGNNRNSDWWRWEQVPGRIHDGSVSGIAADHYNRYEEDLDLAAAMHNNAYRMSVEWARIEPEEGKWDPKEIEHYRKVLTAARERGMKTMLTLWHFTVPQWFADQGDWGHPKAIKQFVRFTKYVAEGLGDLIDYWNTLNEPNVFISQGYISGAWPPQKKNLIKGLYIGWRLIQAHKAAYKVLHKMLDDPEKGVRIEVGLAQNAISVETYRLHKVIDYIGMRMIDWWWNHSFYTFSKGTHDFLGLNYYFHYRLKRFGWPPTTFFAEVRRERRDTTDVGWEVNPNGIFKMLKDMEHYGLPIYITENGLPSKNDDRRKRFIVGYLKELYHAIHSGVDVRGYFFWSLIDNFEWEKGYTAKFGLVEVDFETQKRTPRGSFDVYRNICKANGIPHDMLRYVGHAVDQPYDLLKTGVHAKKKFKVKKFKPKK